MNTLDAFWPSSLLQFDSVAAATTEDHKMEEMEVPKELATRGLQLFYERIVEQLGSLDQKAQAMVSLEGLLPALIAAFSNSISNNSLAQAATWASMILILASALSSLMVMRISYGTKIIASAPNIEDGLKEHEKMARQQAKVSQCYAETVGCGLVWLGYRSDYCPSLTVE